MWFGTNALHVYHSHKMILILDLKKKYYSIILTMITSLQITVTLAWAYGGVSGFKGDTVVDF